MKTFILDSIDVPHTEGMAVLQALYSRSLKSVEEQLPTVTQERSEQFISKHVIGYGHDSVLDTTQIAIFIEDVSMLVAKAIQDTPLYSGTECSTRYIDFATQRFHNPDSSISAGVDIHDKLRAFYVKNTPKVLEFNRGRFPQQEGQSDTMYENALKAKTFDIMRAWLPTGATTNLSWIGSIRHINERLQLLRFHPLKEVSDLAHRLIADLNTKYPASCRINSYSDETLAYMEANAKKFFHLDNNAVSNLSEEFSCRWSSGEAFDIYYNNKAIFLLINSIAYDYLKDRPKNGPISRMPCAPNVHINHFTDFGSFRDIQRQRNCIQQIPLLTTYLGFESWYLENLPEEVKSEGASLIEEITKFTYKNDSLLNRADMQYFIPMGFRVNNVISTSIPQLVYMAELRSSRFVHPTARCVGLNMANFLEEVIPCIKIYPDRSESDFDVARGKQTISEK